MLEGKVAVVIGASSKDGIGYGIAEDLAKKKVNLVLAARRYEFIQKFATEFEKNYNIQALAVETDATNYEHVEHLFRETKKKFGRLDILVNALGVFMPSSILEIGSPLFSMMPCVVFIKGKPVLITMFVGFVGDSLYFSSPLLV